MLLTSLSSYVHSPLICSLPPYTLLLVCVYIYIYNDEFSEFPMSRLSSVFGDMAENNSVLMFERFFQGWMLSHDEYLEELLTMEQRNIGQILSEDVVVRDLVSRVLTHYQLYYEEKSRVIEKNVFLVLSPPWFTPLERTFLWIGGFKPGLAFRIVDDVVGQLSGAQRRRMNVLQEETRTEERALSDELARIQESVAAPLLMQLARLAGKPERDGEMVGCDTVTESLSSAMETVVRNADLLRTTTALKVVEILTPLQNVKFLGAVGSLYKKIRTWGLHRNIE